MSKLSTPAEKKVQEDKQQEAFAAKFKYLKNAFSAIAATEEGVDVLRYLMDICSFQKPTITMDPISNEVNTKMSLYLEARRGVYLDIRKYLPDALLKKIEYK